MAFPLFHYPPDTEPPFTLVVEHHEKTQNASWTPSSFVRFSPTLRTSGFLSAMPAEELKDFLLLLTFLSPSGVCAPTLPELAKALHVSHAKARARLNRLLKTRWHGHPIILCYGNESGLDTYTLSPGLLPVREDEAIPALPSLSLMTGKNAREYSRRTYARPRAEVEREIAVINNWKISNEPETTEEKEGPEAALIRDLLAVGLLREQAEDLVSHFDEVRIRRQLMWLPYRAVRSPIGFLMAAVKDNYAAPPCIIRTPTSETDSAETPPHE